MCFVAVAAMLSAAPDAAIASEVESGLNNADPSSNYLTFNNSVTYFYQNIPKLNRDAHGVKLDFRMDANLHQIGWMNRAKLTIHGEANLGNSVNGLGGIMMPVNTALAYPGENGSDRYDLSSIYLTRAMGNRSALIVGKINVFEFAIRRGSGGAGLDYFMNAATVAAPTGFMPPTILGGLFVGETEHFKYTYGLYDPNSWTNRFDLGNAFEDGVTLFAGYDFKVKIGGRSGTQGFKLAYSSKEGYDLDELSLPSANLLSARKGDRYFLGYTFKHFIVENPDRKDAGWGVFGQVGVSDGNPSTLDHSFVIGVGGDSLTLSRPQDKWGLAYYRYSVSDPIVRELSGLGVPLRDEQGIEAFYNYHVNDRLSISANIQYIRPVLGVYDNLTVFGLRLKTSF